MLIRILIRFGIEMFERVVSSAKIIKNRLYHPAKSNISWIFIFDLKVANH